MHGGGDVMGCLLMMCYTTWLLGLGGRGGLVSLDLIIGGVQVWLGN